MTLRPNLNSIITRLILFGIALVIASSLARSAWWERDFSVIYNTPSR